MVCAKFDSDDDPQREEAGEVINLNGKLTVVSSVVTDTSVGTGTSGDTRTVSHVVSGDDTFLLVFVGNYDTDTTRQYATGVTYAGDALTQRGVAGRISNATRQHTPYPIFLKGVPKSLPLYIDLQCQSC